MGITKAKRLYHRCLMSKPLLFVIPQKVHIYVPHICFLFIIRYICSNVSCKHVRLINSLPPEPCFQSPRVRLWRAIRAIVFPVLLLRISLRAAWTLTLKILNSSVISQCYKQHLCWKREWKKSFLHKINAHNFNDSSMTPRDVLHSIYGESGVTNIHKSLWDGLRWNNTLYTNIKCNGKFLQNSYHWPSRIGHGSTQAAQFHGKSKQAFYRYTTQRGKKGERNKATETTNPKSSVGPTYRSVWCKESLS